MFQIFSPTGGLGAKPDLARKQVPDEVSIFLRATGEKTDVHPSILMDGRDRPSSAGVDTRNLNREYSRVLLEASLFHLTTTISRCLHVRIPVLRS